MYGRKIIVGFILNLVLVDEAYHNSTDASKAQGLVVNQTQSLFNAFLEKETSLLHAPRDPETEACHIVELGHMTSLVCDLLDGYQNISDEAFFCLTWLKPMLSSLIESNTKPVRTSVQNLVSRLFDGPPVSFQPLSPFRSEVDE